MGLKTHWQWCGDLVCREPSIDRRDKIDAALSCRPQEPDDQITVDRDALPVSSDRKSQAQSSPTIFRIGHAGPVYQYISHGADPIEVIAT